MGVYLTIILICLFFLMLASVIRELDFLLSLILIIILIFVSGLRYQVGTDFNTYVHFINLIKDGYDTYMEPGFELLIKLLAGAGFENQAVFLFSSVITLVFFFLFIIKHSNQYTLSVVIFFLFPIFYLASFNGVRQFIAISIFLYAIRFVIRKQMMLYILFISIGSLFHKTILLMLPIYFILDREISLKNVFAISFFYICIVSFLPFIGRALGFPEKYFTDALATDGNNYKALVYPLIFISYFIFKEKYKNKFNDANITCNMLLIGSLISITPLISSLPAAPTIRMSSYFTPIVIIFLANLTLVFRTGLVRVLYCFSIILLSFVYFYITVFIDGERYKLLPFIFNLKVL